MTWILKAFQRTNRENLYSQRYKLSPALIAQTAMAALSPSAIQMMLLNTTDATALLPANATQKFMNYIACVKNCRNAPEMCVCVCVYRHERLRFLMHKYKTHPVDGRQRRGAVSQLADVRHRKNTGLSGRTMQRVS